MVFIYKLLLKYSHSIIGLDLKKLLCYWW